VPIGLHLARVSVCVCACACVPDCLLQAFLQALNSENVGAVVWAAYLSLQQKGVKDIVPALSPAVQLCLVQQVGACVCAVRVCGCDSVSTTMGVPSERLLTALPRASRGCGIPFLCPLPAVAKLVGVHVVEASVAAGAVHWPTRRRPGHSGARHPGAVSGTACAGARLCDLLLRVACASVRFRYRALVFRAPTRTRAPRQVLQEVEGVRPSNQFDDHNSRLLKSVVRSRL
jgi:hypothetical protein